MEVKISDKIKDQLGITTPKMKMKYRIKRVLTDTKIKNIKNAKITFKEVDLGSLYIFPNKFLKTKGEKIAGIVIGGFPSGYVSVDVIDCRYFYQIKELFEQLEKDLKLIDKNCTVSMGVNDYNAKNTEELKKYIMSEEL